MVPPPYRRLTRGLECWLGSVTSDCSRQRCNRFEQRIRWTDLNRSVTCHWIEWSKIARARERAKSSFASKSIAIDRPCWSRWVISLSTNRFRYRWLRLIEFDSQNNYFSSRSCSKIDLEMDFMKHFNIFHLETVVLLRLHRDRRLNVFSLLA